jgi:hypothetical protein
MEDIKKECEQATPDQRATLGRLQTVFTVSSDMIIFIRQ